MRTLDGLVDVYLPDLKYFSEEYAVSYSSAPQYFEVASEAISEMYRQVGAITLDTDGIAQRGVIVRHLVLPAHRHDSIALLERLALLLPVDKILISLMRQYTPDFADENAPATLRRRLTSFEYDAVIECADRLGFRGFSQSKESASADFTPSFNK